MEHAEHVESVEIVDYTGPEQNNGFYPVDEVELDVQAYTLRRESETGQRRTIDQTDGDGACQARILALPNTALHYEWSSLVFDDALPSKLLRSLVRMVGIMRQPGLNLSTFNWNRLCLLHGPPGSGKSTLCRALAQKLSIRLASVFAKSALVEINTNAMLSKYFGESGKLIGNMFERVRHMAQEQNSLIVVVMDEVETIAASRERATRGTECSDGLRVRPPSPPFRPTISPLTLLPPGHKPTPHRPRPPPQPPQRPRSLHQQPPRSHRPSPLYPPRGGQGPPTDPASQDPAFLDRVDIQQLIPSPSPAAIYNIFRSCLNELLRSHILQGADDPPLPSLAETLARLSTAPHAHTPARRVWALARRCRGLSGRTLRRLPVLALARYTWGGHVALAEAVRALEAAVEQEVVVAAEGGQGGCESGGCG